jgi:hypothetical protein
MWRRFVSQHVGGEVLTAVTVKSTIYLDVPPSSPQMYPRNALSPSSRLESIYRMLLAWLPLRP